MKALLLALFAISTAAAAVSAPPEIRSMIATADKLNDRCRGSLTADPNGPICSRRDHLVQRLKASGWCWGGADIEADKRWLPCSDDQPGAPGYRFFNR